VESGQRTRCGVWAGTSLHYGRDDKLGGRILQQETRDDKSGGSIYTREQCPSRLALLPDSLSAEMKFVALHVNFRAAECNPLHLQPEALFGAVFAGELDGATRSQHAMPWQSGNGAEDTNYLARRARRAGSARHCSVA